MSFMHVRGRSDGVAGGPPPLDVAVGDRVALSLDGKTARGVVVQVTERLAAVRVPAGHCVCVTENDLAAGAKLVRLAER